MPGGRPCKYLLKEEIQEGKQAAKHQYYARCTGDISKFSDPKKVSKKVKKMCNFATIF